MFPTLVEMFNITGLSNVYITCGHANCITRIQVCTRTHVLVLEYTYFLSTSTRVRRKVIILEYITNIIVLTITSHDYIFII